MSDLSESGDGARADQGRTKEPESSWVAVIESGMEGTKNYTPRGSLAVNELKYQPGQKASARSLIG